MNKLAIDNLNTIIHQDQYSHICLNAADLIQFTNIPEQKRKFYGIRNTLDGRRGFFNNGKTLCWISYTMPLGHIRISDKRPISIADTCWSDSRSFQEENGAIKVAKYMKLKVFW